jgi:hypothetical protein
MYEYGNWRQGRVVWEYSMYILRILFAVCQLESSGPKSYIQRTGRCWMIQHNNFVCTLLLSVCVQALGYPSGDTPRGGHPAHSHQLQVPAACRPPLPAAVYGTRSPRFARSRNQPGTAEFPVAGSARDTALRLCRRRREGDCRPAL